MLPSSRRALLAAFKPLSRTLLNRAKQLTLRLPLPHLTRPFLSDQSSPLAHTLNIL